MLDELLADGTMYMFVSNSDNLGATLDTGEWSNENIRLEKGKRERSERWEGRRRVEKRSDRGEEGRGREEWSRDKVCNTLLINQ